MKIVNIVALAYLSKPVDLDILANNISDTEFSTSNTSWLKMKLKPENYYIAFYKSGKFLVTGITNLAELDNVAMRVLLLIKKASAKASLKIDTIAVKNIVLMDVIKSNIVLEKLYASLIDEDISYEPDQFPAIILHKNGASFLIFNSGKIILTGIDNVATGKKYLNELKKEIKTMMQY